MGFRQSIADRYALYAFMASLSMRAGIAIPCVPTNPAGAERAGVPV